MNYVHATALITVLLILINGFFEYTDYKERKDLVINNHLQTEMHIVEGISRSAERWIRHNILLLNRKKETVENEVFDYFVAPVLLFKNGDAWIYNKNYVIYDKSSDYPDIYRGKSIKEIFEIQKHNGASHYEELVNGVLSASEGSGWYIWLPEKGKEWVSWTSVKVGEDTWTIGLSTPENEILEANGMNQYLRKCLINSGLKTSLLIIIFIIVFIMNRNNISKENRLLKEKKIAEEANRTKSRFLSNISHEIRTPINNIMGLAYMISETDLNEEQKEYINLIQSSSDYLMENINQLLDISKIEAGKFIIENKIFSLKNILDKTARVFHFTAKNKNLTFLYEPDISPETCNVMGDEKILKHITNNLLGNAVKYTDIGHVLFAAVTEELPDNRIKLIITVEDTGIGIPEPETDKIFNYFYQVKEPATEGKHGTGLGLTIVKDLIDLSGGEITVESSQNKGSVFKTVLYYDKMEKQLPPEIDESPDSEFDTQITPVKSRNLSVLIAEDDNVSALYLKSILNKLSCDVVHVKNGMEALSARMDIDFDLFIIDGQMPVMDGIETIKQIRAYESEHSLNKGTIIALTAYAMPEEKQSFIEAGADGYLSKPINRDLLISIIEKSGAAIKT